MERLLKRKVLVSMLFFGLTFMGFFSYQHLSMELYPSADLPLLNVSVGMAQELDPGYTEMKAVIPLEGVISMLEGVEKIESRISPRNASISVTFSPRTNVKYAYLKLEEKVKAIDIPAEFSVSVTKASTAAVSSQFMSLFVLSGQDVDYARHVTDKDVVPALENIEGVAGVRVMGGRQKSMEIIVDKYKCEALGISRSQIGALISRNTQEKTYVGPVYEDNKRYFVNITAEYLETEHIGSIVVAQGPVLLKDIADIRFGIKEEDSYARVNGKEVITCIVAKSPQVNVIDLSEKVRSEIEQLNSVLEARDISLKVDTDVAETMKSNLDIIIDLAVTGAILAIFILYLFLRNFKIVAIIALSIPISIFSSFNLFYWGDISINTLTLTGIALAVGMLLDNSVVVMENIFRLRSTGLSAGEAVVQGTKEVWKSVFAATLTTITVFLPFLFADNVLIQLVGEHVGISIVSTLLVSLVVALLLIPMAIHYFMHAHKGNERFSSFSPYSRPVQVYVALLKMSLRRPALVIIGALVLFIGVLALTLTLSLNTLKEVETDTFNVYITSPSGYTLERTDEVIRRYEEELLKIEEVEEISSKVYAADANVTIKLKEDFERINDKDIVTLKNNILSTARSVRIRDISLEARSNSDNFQGGGEGLLGGNELLRLMGLGDQTEKIIIKGQDFIQMENLGEHIQYQLQELDNMNNAWLNLSRGIPEARIQFDAYLMGIYDVSPANVVSELNNFAPENVTQMKYKTADDEYDIIIKDKEYTEDLEEEEKNVRNLDELRHLKVTNQKQALVGLEQFSKMNLTRGKGNIIRVNQEKEIEVRYRFNQEVNESKKFLTSARQEVDELIQAIDIPSGLSVEVVHEADDMKEFTFLILAAFMIIFMILASVFESLSAPIVLMFSIPLAAIGSLQALLLTNNSLMNANVLTGFIILVGIVVNNSIILIDYTSILRRRGFRKPRALLVAGISRLRPILITTLTTIIAMLPLAMGKGEFVAGLGAPFAITVIGGLTMSTILTLIIIPTLYSGLEDALKRLRAQSRLLKIIQIILMLAAVCGIVLLEDSIWWRLAYLVLAFILTPALTWFMDSSLRRAKQDIIPEHEEIVIEVRNLVKTYGRPSLFNREFMSGYRIRSRLGIKASYRSWKDLRILLWLAPLTVFFYYFSCVYQTIAFWSMFGGVIAWMLSLYVLSILKQLAAHRLKKGKARLLNVIFFVIYYLMPLLFTVWGMVKFKNAIILVIALCWYFGMLIHGFANRMRYREVHIDSLEGKLKWLRRSLYKLSMKIPFIGYRKPPFKALSAVSMEIRTGMFGLLGPNGAGKTTLMRIICGIFEQSYGKIFINGIDTQKKREELQGLIGYLPQEFGTYENLTSRDYLDYQALLKGIYDKGVREKRIKEVLEAVHMYENKDKKIGSFSGGMKQRIGIAQTLLNLPRILVVDEPTAGLDPRERIRFRNLLVELSRERIVIFSTHIIEDIASSCNQVAVINKGSLKYLGTPWDMVNMAKDVTWVFDVPASEYERLPEGLLIVHHIRIDDMIRIRCLSESKPVSYAKQTHPVLEDAYLWLLRGVKLNEREEIITSSNQV